MSHPGLRLSKTTLETKYRMALSRLHLAKQEIEQLEVGEYGETLHFTLAHLEETIGSLVDNQSQAAEQYGFTPREGIGPGDWRNK